MRTTWIPLAVVAAALTLAGLPFTGAPTGVATSAVQEGGATTEQQFAQAARWRRVMKPEQAVEVYRQLAQDPDLTPEERTRAAYLAAQTLEFIPGQGEAARLAYLDFRNAHPDEPLGVEAALRLGILYDNVLLGLTEDDAKAKEQYEWVVAHAPATAHATLVARQYLGGILLRKRQFDQALPQFEAIYAADPDAVETPPAEAAIVPKADPVATQVLRLQVRAVDMMVASCRAKRGEAAVTALKTLIEKYRDDAFVRETAEDALRKMGSDPLMSFRWGPTPFSDAPPEAAQSSASEEGQSASLGRGLIALLDGYWDPDPPIEPPEVTAPADGTYAYAGQEVQCHATRAYDEDTYYEGEQGTPDEDELVDETAVHWVCQEGVGQWKDGNTGLSPIWLGAEGTMTCVLRVKDRDLWASEREENQARADLEEDEWVTDATSVKMVRVDHIEYQDPVNGWVGVGGWETGEGEVYVPLGAQCSFRACHNPNVEGWPTGKPTWGGTAEGETNGDLRDVTLTTLDQKTISASCGNTITITLKPVRISALQYDHPVNGWTTVSVPGTPGTLAIPVGSTVTFRAVRDPAGEDWPSGCPAWTLDDDPLELGEDPAVQELTFEEEQNYDLKAQCGNMVVLHVMVFDPTVEMTAYARDGTTALGDKVTVAAHVRLNEDDDDADGGGTVQDKDDNDVRLPDGTPTEDDLIKVRFTFDPGFEHLQVGKVVLKRENSKIRLWKKHYKGGSANEFAFDQAGNTEKVYNLSNATHRSAFLSDVRDTNAWVEGSVASGGLKDTGLLLIYRDQDDEEVDSDLVKFTVIRSNLVPYTADGATPIFLDKRDTPGVYIWYNRDDDDQNDTEDRDDVLTTVTGEDDLLKVQCLFNNFFATLQAGRVVLERVNATLRLWRSSTKGDGQEIGFTNNRKVYDLSGQDRQAFLDQVHGKNLWLEGYEYSANLRDTSLSLIYEDPNGKEVCRSSVVYTVLKLDVTHIAFNVDRSGIFADGMNIRRSGTANTEIRAPEWWGDSADQDTEPDTNDAKCYQADSQVTVRARITVTPSLKSVEIAAIGTRAATGDLSLGNLGAERGVAHSWTSVAFESGVSTGDTVESLAGFVQFLPQNNTTCCIQREEAKWQFQIRSVNADYVFLPLSVTAPGQRAWITIYTTWAAPLYPWSTVDTDDDDPRHPWVSALEFVTQTANAKGRTDYSAMVQLTTYLFSGHGMAYDT
jgi:tetratricopeptide (TPR) repeat protein